MTVIIPMNQQVCHAIHGALKRRRVLVVLGAEPSD
jgi:hypothetical protein